MIRGVPAGRLSARLHHIALGSPDPRRLADFYAKTMDLRLTPSQGGVLGQAKERCIYFLPGAARTLAFAGYAVDEDQLTGLAVRLDAHGVASEIHPDGTEVLAPGAISIADPDGHRLLFGVPRSAEGFEGDLPARLQHVVVASRNAARLSGFYQDVLGFTLSDNVEDAEGGLRTAFLRCSEEHHSFAVFQAATDRFDHHCYEAGDWGLIRDWGDRFAEHEVPVAWGPGRHGPGNNLFIFIHDPDENWVEISAELEIVEPDRPVGVWPHAQRTLNKWGSAPLRS